MTSNDENLLPSAQKIVSVKKNHNGYEELVLDEDLLSCILLQEKCKDTECAVLSFTGVARSGKSYLLNEILRFYYEVKGGVSNDIN